MQRRVTAGTVGEVVLALALFGAIPVVIKAISADPFTIGIFRLAIAASGAVVFARHRGELRVSSGEMLRHLLLGSIFFAHWITYFFAIKISSASIAAIGLSTYGIHLLVLSAITGAARLHVRDLVAVTLAICGALLVVPQLSLRSSVTAGIGLATVSAFLYATLPLLHQRFSAIPSSARTAGQFVVALLLFLIFLPRSDWRLTGHDWAGLWFLAVGSTLIGHSLWVRVTTTLSPAATSIIYYGNLPFALALSATLLGERLTLRALVGALLILGGGVLGLLGRGRSAPADP